MNNVKNVFSIKDLENLSGIKAHTIRIWEKRYNVLESLEYLKSNGIQLLEYGYKKILYDDFVLKSNLIHNFKYLYSNEEYDGVKDKVKIICKIHGKFEQKGYSHLRGHGCNKCAKEINDFVQNTNNDDLLVRAVETFQDMFIVPNNYEELDKILTRWK